VQQARTTKEKIVAFEEFLSAIPKHKGNERLRAQTKRKIALLKAEVQAKQRRATARVTQRSIQKAGAAQIAIVGLTKAGRSSLLAALTAARPQVATYPYATKESVPGMLQFEDLQFQLVELPAPIPEEDGRFAFQEGSTDLIRNCEGLIVMVDLSIDPIQQLDQIMAELARSQVSIVKSETNVSIMRTRSGGVQFLTAGRLIDCTRDQIITLLRSYGISNAMIRSTGDVSLNDIEEAVLGTGLVYKPTIVVANKADLPQASGKAQELIEREGSRMRIIVASCLTRQGLSELGRSLFETLDIIRIYTKEPKAPTPSPEPFVVRKGTSIGALSQQIHSALFRQFKYARVWGKSVSYGGERVGIDHVLMDGDTVEIHA